MKHRNDDSMIAWLIGATMVVVFTTAVATGAAGQQLGLRCAPYSMWLEHAEERYGETLQSRGELNDGGAVEMWANTDNGSWTLILLPPETHPMAGQACAMGAGTDYEGPGREGDLL